jgi:hypothetical protein
MGYLNSFLNSDGFMPHGHCFLWTPGLLWLSVVSDSLIGLAYLTILITLIYFVQKRRDIPFNGMFVAFGVFILACGATHVMDVCRHGTPPTGYPGSSRQLPQEHRYSLRSYWSSSFPRSF